MRLRCHGEASASSREQETRKFSLTPKEGSVRYAPRRDRVKRSSRQRSLTISLSNLCGHSQRFMRHQKLFDSMKSGVTQAVNSVFE